MASAQFEHLRKTVSDCCEEEEKLSSAVALRQHILTVKKERDTYNMCIKKAISNDVHAHYTFDFSQSVCLPHHVWQMSPFYFASLWKVQVFWFRIDNVPLQLNFLVDENETIGKDGSNSRGPKAVISMVDWALESHNTGETVYVLHATNCRTHDDLWTVDIHLYHEAVPPLWLWCVRSVRGCC